jgi:hypothetical protein
MAAGLGFHAALTRARDRARVRVEDALLGLEDELAALDLRHAALLRAADEQAACGDGEPACTVRSLRARARARTRSPPASGATGRPAGRAARHGAAAGACAHPRARGGRMRGLQERARIAVTVRGPHVCCGSSARRMQQS